MTAHVAPWAIGLCAAMAIGLAFIPVQTRHVGRIVIGWVILSWVALVFAGSLLGACFK